MTASHFSHVCLVRGKRIRIQEVVCMWALNCWQKIRHLTSSNNVLYKPQVTALALEHAVKQCMKIPHFNIDSVIDEVN